MIILPRKGWGGGGGGMRDVWFLKALHHGPGHPLGGGGGTLGKYNVKYGYFLGDLNDYFTQEGGRDEGRLVFKSLAPRARENTGLCKLKVTSLCNSFTNVFNLLYACKFLPCDNLIVKNILDSNSHQYCDKYSVKVQANVAEVQREEERSWEQGWQWYCV